jgi:hypothetical protein
MADYPTYKLDRTAFFAGTVQEADERFNDYSKHTWQERMRISYYLTSEAYCFDPLHPPKLDRTAFEMKKCSHGSSTK